MVVISHSRSFSPSHLIRQNGRDTTVSGVTPSTLSLKLTKGDLILGFPPSIMTGTQSASTLAKQEKSHNFHSPTMDSFSMSLTPFLTWFSVNSDLSDLFLITEGGADLPPSPSNSIFFLTRLGLLLREGPSFSSKPGRHRQGQTTNGN